MFAIPSRLSLFVASVGALALTVLALSAPASAHVPLDPGPDRLAHPGHAVSAAATPWGNYVVVAVIALLVGATVTYTWTRVRFPSRPVASTA